MTDPDRTLAPAGPPIALVGLRCSGKSTVGRLLASELSLGFVDLDERVVEVARHAGETQRTVGQLFAALPRAHFRDYEAAALRACVEAQPSIVLATGGGVVERADNRSWLVRTTRCVWLDVPLEVLARRMDADPTERPPILAGEGTGETELERVAAQRGELYRQVAQVHLRCGDRDAESLARELASNF